MDVAMGPNRYGKSGIRLAVVDRESPIHRLLDLEVDIRLSGDFAAAHTEGDNRQVLPTDTMRGTCLAMARDGIDSAAGFAVRLARRFLEAVPASHRAMVQVTRHPWDALAVDGQPHPHTFVPAGGGRPRWTVALDRHGEPVVIGGIVGARVAKTTGSAFSGFLVDEFTTLPEARERIMATTIDAAWGTAGAGVDHDRLAEEVPATMLAAFAGHDDSESVQHTLHAMGSAVLAGHPEVTWARFKLPNEHHILADLSAYGRDNPDVVYVVADRPYGVIEGAVAREGVVPEVPW